MRDRGDQDKGQGCRGHVGGCELMKSRNAENRRPGGRERNGGCELMRSRGCGGWMTREENASAAVGDEELECGE